ncbi:putative receptor-like protein kinase At3g47110 [Coffea arabica]|uniref:non-specific serine/threonine protein kinase n=2 Tax=Coffea TaxID=13442 RepID=A0A6P6UCW0_COFAR|nr:receptor kinase-like protein Xa21 isoform X1 [Coffea arabica]
MSNKLSNLKFLSLQQNHLTGIIPTSISNASKLVALSLHDNELTGSIPNSLGSLGKLELLNLDFNRLSGESSSPELSFLTFLTSCRSLKYLVVGYNPLNGFLPASFSNHSTSLVYFTVSNCKIKGNIPTGIGNLSSLLHLDFSGNELVGSIPKSFNRLKNLQVFYLGINQIRDVLNIFCELHSLGLLQLSQNQFFGGIPECLGNMINLTQIFLDSNNLTSMIPANLLSMKNLQVLNLSLNFLSGSLPLEIGNLKAAYNLDLSINQLSNIIPTTIGELQALQNFSLAKNNLRGSIPESVSNMVSLEFLDLSHNNLSGVIPKSMEALKNLKECNVSFNRLSGEIPQGGPFRNFTGQFFINNEALCGDSRLNVPPCQRNSTRRSTKRKVLLLVISLSGIAAILIIAIGAILTLRRLKKRKGLGGTELMLVAKYERFSYYDLLQSTDNYNESNLLGEGSFGSVYKGILSDGIVVAVKVFNLQVEGASTSFDRECEILKSLRHRNLTKVLGNCSNPDFKALVLKYMPNGNLEKWLYSHNHFLDLFQRVNIMIDVACALEYLHYSYYTPVVHCDLKPSNILLDEDMVASVSDFGITKMFGEGESILHTVTLATLGYIAPEYGSEGLVSRRIDVYSFGIVLMETFSRVKPSDEMFSSDLSLKSWVEDSLPNALQVIDANLIRPEDEHFTGKLKCVILILKLALNCCRESPGERMNMKDVLAELKNIKRQLLMTQTVRPRVDQIRFLPHQTDIAV